MNYFAIRKPKTEVLKTHNGSNKGTEFGQGSFKGYKSGDVLVLFGELFNRGYANGLIQTAESIGMKVIYSTVGRRTDDNQLRALNAEELAAARQPLINVPLEAGFDLEKNAKGISPVDQISAVKLSGWEDFQMDEEGWMDSQRRGKERFASSVQNWVRELEAHLQPGKNVVFAHLMAGGVPRAKILMPLMNRALKGFGDRFLSSEKLWNSSIGKFTAQSFFEVTAETFNVLVHETTALRKKLEAAGSQVSYSAYGYHGTEVLVQNNYLWQSYSPYVQGWAKLRLENYAEHWKSKGVHCAVYNCPEILTNSSAVFSGVEVSLYPLMGALRKEGGKSLKAQKMLQQCQQLLKPEVTLDQLLEKTDRYLTNVVIREHCDFAKWPQHNSQPQLEMMLNSSEELVNLHLDTKKLITQMLSEVVIEACGAIMLADVFHPEAAVAWINHDVIAKYYSAE